MYFYKLLCSVNSKICFVLVLGLVLLPMVRMILFSSTYENVYDILLEIMSSGMPCMICSFFISDLFTKDEKNGYIKNIMISLNNRSTLFFSRVMITLIFLSLIYFVVILSSFVLYGLILKVKIIHDISVIQKLIISYWLSFSYLSMINMIITITKSLTCSVVITLISLSGLIALPVIIINMLINSIFRTDSLELSEYMLSTCLKEVSYNIDLSRYLFVGLAYIVLSTIVSLLVLRKRDI